MQYVDDLLVAAKTFEGCKEETKTLLMTLNDLGYKVSAKKPQICQQTVTYLGYQLQGGNRTLSNERVQAILQILAPKTKKQVLVQLDIVGSGY